MLNPTTAVRCPECRSTEIDIQLQPFDFGRCIETGYYDAGENATFHCPTCGATGDAEGDLEYFTPGPLPTIPLGFAL